MNQRAKNKAEKRRRHQICKALDLCLQINGLQESKRSITGDHPTALLRFYGHMAELQVDICPVGWHSNCKEREWLNAHIKEPKELDEMIQRLEKFKMDQHSGNCGDPDNKK